jgi:hypothetical protein
MRREDAMSTKIPPAHPALTSHEAEQVRQIAAWKSQPPNPFSEMARMITMPVARWLEKVIPDPLVEFAVEKAYSASELLAGHDDIQRKAGVRELVEMRDKPLDLCDRLASEVGIGAQAISLIEGAATGAGGVLTTLLDIPVLFVLSLRTIRKVGHCYGYALDREQDKPFVLGLLIASMAGSLHIKRERVDQLHELEELLLLETQQEVIAEEFVSLLFQLEVFEEIPGIGAISGALLNLAFVRRLDITARRVFQERWLRDNGKIIAIEAAPAPAHHLAAGLGGALARAGFSASYALGFAVAMPVYVVAAVFRPLSVFASGAPR